MRFVDEYRDSKLVKIFTKNIVKNVSQPWTIMEICGGQTHSIFKYGIDQLLPPEITLIHGPGCPVCVTSIELIDYALIIANLPNVIFCSFGDMLRVPGTSKDLLMVKASGGDVRIVYSPLDSLKIAQENPDKQIVFFAVGFETTAPATAMAVYQAKHQNIKNFSLLVSHVLVPPAMKMLLSSPNCTVQGFLAAGHVCTITGYEDYQAISNKHKIPIIVTGFEPLDILKGIYQCVLQLESGKFECKNQYFRSVKIEGNILAKQLVQEIFTTVSRCWRGIGEISESGLSLRPEYQFYDALNRFKISKDKTVQSAYPEVCISGDIMQGQKKPYDCPAFGNVCTPESPLGAPMVSSEGTCAAYYRYRSHSPQP
ncbi:MAG: hydrogenase formation protein HypD [Candidatus Atelocyanobacterium thalassa]